MLVVAKAFTRDALKTLRELPPDQVCGEIPDAKGFFVCRGREVPPEYAFLEFLEDGDLVGVLCQKK